MSLARISSKASEMYLRKISPRTTCLYSAASMLLRSLSAASQSLASKPRLADESAAEVVLVFALGGMKVQIVVLWRSRLSKGKGGCRSTQEFSLAHFWPRVGAGV